MFQAPLTTLPTAAGIGLRAPHHAVVLAERPAVAWWEVHSENFFADGGPALRFLERVRADTAISLHGVSASLGSDDHLFERHLERLSRLVKHIEPAAVSEHLCWSSQGNQHYNDLLPLPYTHEALTQVCRRIAQMQDQLERPVLIENVSSYLQWRGADFNEWDFLVEVAQRSGCGILLDINNIYVSACNHGFNAATYIEAIPAALVSEIHLAGYSVCDDFLVDTHGDKVQAAVWALYQHALEQIGPRPTLIEWDTDIPALPVLLGEAAQAQQRLDLTHAAEEARHACAA